MSDEIYRQKTLQVATANNGVVPVARETTMELGQPRDTTVLAFIRDAYPAKYNDVVRNMNRLKYQPNMKNKWTMRGGHFFLYRYVILLVSLLSFGFGIASIYVKACVVVPFVFSVLYITLSILNIVIFTRNQLLINPLVTKQVPRGQLDGMINRFYTIPMNATVLTGVDAASIDPAVIAAAVQRENIQLKEINFMLYDDQYLSQGEFSIEILVHIFIFFILFILAIIFVSTYPIK